MDLSIADTIKYIAESCNLDLYDIESLDDYDKYEVVFAVRELNREYLEKKKFQIKTLYKYSVR
ncbi:hypothetical protein [Halanaerobium hydrogeniformans]|nr:hypothetical protein [Halanaerobium hydrogeniformans]